MAHLTFSRSAATDMGGHNHQHHQLLHDSAAATRHSTQRSPSPDASSNSTHHNEGRGSIQSATEDNTNEDEEEDESATQDDGEDEPDVLTPSHGRGKGKGLGKRPAIRVDHVVDDESLVEADETSSHETEIISNKYPTLQRPNNKKRTFSNLSSTSVLFGDDSTDQDSFPRRKTARKLSNVSSKPLLTYKEEDEDTSVNFDNAIESDDEDYSGVNLIPDDESDLDFMEEQEETFIRHEEQQATALLNEFRDARRLSLDSCATDDIFDVTAPLDQSFISGLPDLGFAQFFEPEPLPASPDLTVKRKYSDSSTKRVRFDDEVQVSDSSSSESSDLDSSVFPDLFLDQDQLPPVLHQLLEIDHDNDDDDIDSPQSDASFWDFGHEEHRITQVDDSDEDDSSADSSGYDSDMGDTTDEDDFGSDVPKTPIQNKSVLRQPSSAPGSRAATPKPFQRSSRPIGRQVPPTRGVFIHDDTSKAIAVTNKDTKNVTFYRPRPVAVSWLPKGYQSSTSSTTNNSPRNSIAQVSGNINGSDSEVSNEVFNNALHTDIMLTGIFGAAPGNDGFFMNNSVGPPEAFFPFVSIGANGQFMDDDEDDDSEDYEDDLNIADFMNFGSEGEDTDIEQDEEETDTPATPRASRAGMDSTPAQSTPFFKTPELHQRTTSDAMLEHFDRGVVNAFRNNQNRYRDIASLPSDPTARASVSRPVKSGKSAETLITPLRKRSKWAKMKRTPLRAPAAFANQSSPLAGVSKASSRLQNSIMRPPRGPGPRMGTFS